MMTLEEFRSYLEANGDRSFPSARGAFRAALSSSCPGRTVSLHETHVLLGGERTDLPVWARSFLDVLDRPSMRATLRGRVLNEVLDMLERGGWEPLGTPELQEMLE